MAFEYADLTFTQFEKSEEVLRAWTKWLEEKSELDLDVADAVMTFLNQREVFKLLPDCEMIMVVYGDSDEAYIDIISLGLMNRILSEEGASAPTGGAKR